LEPHLVSYAVKEVFLTCQGEGANLGRVCVFIRFAGCNLWSGREQDRATAICQFCDTDFIGGTRYTTDELVAEASRLWQGEGDRWTVITGGEPLLQLDAPLVEALHAAGFKIAIETNGTLPLPCPVDWVCMSPKAGTTLALDRADELKIVYPQPGAEPERYKAIQASHRWLSPMFVSGHTQANTLAAASYCQSHPVWRLNIQAHKSWGLP
jgi:7-carboxy-7-deazaguanine synthase (Cx14CxxC type)